MSAFEADLPLPQWVEANILYVRGYMVINGRPCTILKKSTLDGKLHFVARDLFTGQKLEATLAPDTSVEIPPVIRLELALIEIEDGMLHLADTDGSYKDDVRLPDNEIGRKIREFYEAETAVNVTVVAVNGEEAAIAVEKAPLWN
ncbi:hypothetical protein ABOM_007398 [Aspergillus bombycis]|uniref:Translation initiation factor 5A C-terminal domain-containing protein n=1 Tax=Aspergillus bombycis TaxID=109264 RepID=A0A1F7ZZ39_9EURO|nr:hypothetical protein ABOM_007398 [Aspergillus bombycis]OGM44732.1 hypothetical protein ABOM_007398 [Aspergillus bombycis]